MGADLSNDGFGDDNFGKSTSDGDSLGSLAQAARTKTLKSARTILLVIGGLTILWSLYYLSSAERLVDQELDNEMKRLRQQGMVDFDMVQVAELKAQAVSSTRMLYGGSVILGAIFIGLGLNIKKYPVPLAITGLVLYLGNIGVFGYLAPETLRQGLIFKFLFIGGLYKAIQAAIAYEKEEQLNATTPPATLLE